MTPEQFSAAVQQRLDRLKLQDQDVTGIGAQQATDFNEQLKAYPTATATQRFMAYEQFKKDWEEEHSRKGYSAEQIGKINAEFDSLADPRNQESAWSQVKGAGHQAMAGVEKFAGNIQAAFNPNWAEDNIQAAEAHRAKIGANAEIANYLQQRDMQAAKDAGSSEFGAAVSSYFDNPRALLGTALEELPPYIGLGLATTGAVAAAPVTGGTSLAAVAPIVMGGAGALTEAGAYRLGMQEKIQGMSEAQLRALPEIQSRIAQGMSFEQAKADYATDFSDHAGGTALAAGVGSIESLTGLGRLGVAKGLKGAAATMVKEPVLQAGQEAAAQLNQNWGYQRIDPNQDITEGVGHSAAVGGLLGVGSGTVSAATQWRSPAEAATPTESQSVEDVFGAPETQPAEPSPPNTAQPHVADQKILESVLSQYKSGVNETEYQSMFNELKQDIENGKIQARANDNDDPQYRDFARAYLSATGQNSNTEQAVETSQNSANQPTQVEEQAGNGEASYDTKAPQEKLKENEIVDEIDLDPVTHEDLSHLPNFKHNDERIWKGGKKGRPFDSEEEAENSETFRKAEEYRLNPTVVDKDGSYLVEMDKYDEGMVRFSFAGRNAQTANHSLLTQAERDLASGKDPETVRQETGWFKGADGKMRFEIDDSQVTFKRDWDKSVNAGGVISSTEYSKGYNIAATLGDILNAPELFAAYPDLANIKLDLIENIYPDEKSSAGLYVSPFGHRKESILLKRDLSLPGTKSILLHELQHAIQERENFARGANPREYTQDVLDEIAPYEKRKNKIRMREIEQQDPDFVRNYNEMQVAIGDWLSYDGGDPEVEAQLEKEASIWESQVRSHPLYDEYREAEYNSANEIYDKMDAYLATAGEVEARNVQTRMNMTAEERLARSPESTEDVHREEQIVRYADGAIANSLNENPNSDFARAVDEVVNGRVRGKFVRMGTTPDVLKMLGLPDTNISINDEVIEKAIAKQLDNTVVTHKHPHNLTSEDLKRLPMQLNNPIAVMKSSTNSTNPNGFVVLTELVEQKNGAEQPVIAALNVRQTEKGLEVVNISSVHGRPISQIKRFLTDDLLYWNKEKGYPFADSVGLQLPRRFSADNLSSRNVKTEADLRQYQSTQNTVQPPDTEIEQARAVLRQALGEHADKIDIIRTADLDQRDSRYQDKATAEGWFQNGKLQINLDNIASGKVLNKNQRLIWVAWHELAHSGVAVRYAPILKNVLTAARKNAVVSTIARRIQTARQKEGSPISNEIATEEALVEIFAAQETGNWAELENRYNAKIHRSWKDGTGGLDKHLSFIARLFKRVVSLITGKNINEHSDKDLFDILAGIKQGIEGNQGNDGTDVLFSRYSDDADKIVRAVEKMGLNAFRDSSRVSGSEYVAIWGGDDSNGEYKIRVSDHALPSHYEQADFDVFARGEKQEKNAHTQGNWVDAINHVAQKFNRPMPKYVQNIFDKENAERIAAEKAKEEAIRKNIEVQKLREQKLSDKESSLLAQVSKNLSKYEQDLAYIIKQKEQGSIDYYRTGSRKNGYFVFKDGTEKSVWDYFPKSDLAPHSIYDYETQLSGLIRKAKSQTESSDIRFSHANEALSETAYNQAKEAGETELTFQQWKQVRSPEFKAWFGDWENDPDDASKVINPRTGEPLVVYHATSAEFYTFDRNELGKETFNNSSNLYYAMTAAVGHWFNSQNLAETINYGDRSVGAFLNIRDPERFGGVDELAGDIEMSGFVPDDKRDIYDFDDTSEINEIINEYVENFKENRYTDGLIVKDEEYGGTSYVAFDANQIKSATDNNGEFSAENEDIRFSRAEDRSKSESLEKLRQSEPIRISGTEIEPSEDLKQYRKNAFEYGKKLREQSPFVNRDTGKEINLQRASLTEILAHDYKNPEHLQSIAAIPQIAENAIYIATLPNEDTKRPDIEQFDYYLAGLNIDGKDYTVRMSVGESDFGELYYDHKLTPIEKGRLLEARHSDNNSGVPQQQSAFDGVNDKRLLQILQDENAENTDDIRFSRKQSVEDLTTTGKAKDDETTLIQDLVARDVDSVKSRWHKGWAKLDEALADSLRPVSDWIDNLNVAAEPIKARIKGRMYRAKNLRDVARSELEAKYMNPLLKGLAELGKKHNKDTLTTKRLVGFYASLRYSIIKNEKLLEADRVALIVGC